MRFNENEIVKIKNGEITIMHYGDPDALKGERDLEWAYIHTISITALKKIVEEGKRIIEQVEGAEKDITENLLFKVLGRRAS
jgi:hypothetical protein